LQGMLYMHKILEIKKGVLLAVLVLGSHFFTFLVVTFVHNGFVEM
jgi:hypothetical protein